MHWNTYHIIGACLGQSRTWMRLVTSDDLKLVTQRVYLYFRCWRVVLYAVRHQKKGPICLLHAVVIIPVYKINFTQLC